MVANCLLLIIKGTLTVTKRDVISTIVKIVEKKEGKLKTFSPLN